MTAGGGVHAFTADHHQGALTMSSLNLTEKKLMILSKFCGV